MKKIYFLLFAVIALGASTAQAVTYTVNISGTSYAPDVVNANVGDTIFIQASGNHPLMEVSQSTWDANGTTMLPGGFGTQTATFMVIPTTAGTIYYVCTAHVGCCDMKGLINVSSTTGILDPNAVSNLQVYPTVVKGGEFTIAGNNELMLGSTLLLYNINGQLVKSFALENEVEVLNASVATGTYTAIVTRNNEALLRTRMVFVAH